MGNLNDSVTPAADLIRETLDTFSHPINLGTLTAGHYVQVGMGMGFYVPEESYQAVQQIANETGRVQFLAIDAAGQPIHGTRDECLDRGNGCVAWIVPA